MICIIQYISLATSIMPSLLNTTAPSFTLTDQNGKTHALGDYAGKYVLLYFYPKDDTPGCTKEACNFRDNMSELTTHDVHVLGVSADDTESHTKFSEKFSLNFPLLSDTDKSVIDAYGVWKKKSMFGKSFMGIARESFLIDPQGKIVRHYEKVKPATHVEEVLADIQELSA